MDLRAQPGFLGTQASLLSDLTLLAYVLILVPAMIIGFVFARRRMHRPQHKLVMTAITLVNWALIALVMLASFVRGVAPGIPESLGQPAIFLPVAHLLFGGAAQLLATYILFRMWREDSQVAAARRRGEDQLSKYWFKSAKPVMRLTLALWLVTALLGAATYFSFYSASPADAAPAPAVTPEAAPDVIEAVPETTPAVTPES